MNKIKRSLFFKTFVNTGTTGTPIWVLINGGVKSGKISANSKTTKETYIHEDTASFSIDSYAPKMPIEAKPTNAETLFEYLDTKFNARATLSTAETEIVNVYLFKGVADGEYLAEKQSVSIQYDKRGGTGGKPFQFNYTINYLGDPVRGTFDPTGPTFTESVDDCFLTALAFTGIDLTPTFLDKRLWYTSETTDATNIITATGPAGSTVVIDNGGDTVISGAAATWTEGVNIVTITSTIGSDVATYIIFVTYTPGA
jgi:hypothetical protein